MHIRLACLPARLATFILRGLAFDCRRRMAMINIVFGPAIDMSHLTCIIEVQQIVQHNSPSATETIQEVDGSID